MCSPSSILHHVDYSDYLSDQGQNILSALAFSTGLWLALILTMRTILKMLLCYHGWMYEQHGKMSNSTKVWLVCVARQGTLGKPEGKWIM